MGKLTVSFVGVCVHLVDNTCVDTEHRVVLINGKTRENINDHWIEPHHAKLKIPGEEPLHLDGMALSIPNAKDPDVDYDPSFKSCIPRLVHFAPDLPRLSKTMAREKQKDLAAAYFDAAGNFWAAIAEPGGASVAIMEVETNGDPVLRMAPFNANGFTDKTLPDGAEIIVENVGDDDADYDFLLNYKIAESIPADATWPTERMRCSSNHKAPPTNVGPGCSNSAYP